MLAGPSIPVADHFITIATVDNLKDINAGLIEPRKSAFYLSSGDEVARCPHCSDSGLMDDDPRHGGNVQAPATATMPPTSAPTSTGREAGLSHVDRSTLPPLHCHAPRRRSTQYSQAVREPLTPVATGSSAFADDDIREDAR
jgi:hypothetical protein